MTGLVQVSTFQGRLLESAATWMRVRLTVSQALATGVYRVTDLSCWLVQLCALVFRITEFFHTYSVRGANSSSALAAVLMAKPVLACFALPFAVPLKRRPGS